MDQKIKSDWLKALRSGEYKQTIGILKCGDNFCCLGVLCAVQGETFENASDLELISSYVPLEYAAGLESHSQKRLAKKNDAGDTFAQIADYIEEYL